ncbi:hypothetical protein D3C86_2104930 [compost metagenome]
MRSGIGPELRTLRFRLTEFSLTARASPGSGSVVAGALRSAKAGNIGSGMPLAMLGTKPL